MKRINVIIILLIFVVSSANAGNDTRAGYYGAFELLIPPSAVTSGMGETGVSHVHGKSFYSNPGSLGLFTLENKIIISGFLKKVTFIDDFGFYNGTVAVPLQKANKETTKFLFAIGGYYSVTEYLTPIPIITYDYPNGTGEFFVPKLKNYNTTFSLGYNGRLQVGIGVTVKKIKEDIADLSISGTSSDFGFIVRYPILPDLSDETQKLYFLPTFGYSVSNLGSDLELGIGFSYPDSNIQRPNLSNTIPLPRKKSIGFSCEIGVLKKVDSISTRNIVSFLPSFEITQIRELDWVEKYGVEFGVAKAMYFRIGRINDDRASEKNTLGFSLSSRGLLSFVQKDESNKCKKTKQNKLITDIISIEYSFANTVYTKSYHEVIVTFQL